ncbi:MAG: NB-ARC domain-containing protein, partial [Actinomycetota bacterium]|nr:NB-ARC domain-containing protein [Actinomycetota bacterium]
MAIVVRLLGEVVAYVDGRSVDLGAPRQRCVLAALAVDVGRVVPVERLVERVWGADVPWSARATLHSYISRLRQALAGTDGVAIERRSGGYALQAERSAVDLHRFRHLCKRADADHTRAALLLAEALGQWHGEALTGLDGEWARAERDRLGREQLSAQHDLVDARLRSGQGENLVVELSTRAGEYPLDERVAGQYMRALYQAGRAADALDHHQRVRTRLIEELGADPSAALQNLHRQILAADASLVANAADEPFVPRQLPAPPAPFVGRHDELRRLDAVLHASDAAGTVAISVIAGTGGIGKTSLALHWAHRVRSRFPDGQLFVNLRGHSAGVPLSAGQALDELLHALGVDQADRPLRVDAAAATYRSALADRRILVVLDDAVDVDQVRPLLPGTAGCTVVITSRNRFDGVVAREGARQIRLDVLAPEDALAVVGAVVGDARVADDEASARELVRLCGRLPLALRIAAAHLSTRPDQPVGDYVTELRTGDRLAALEPHGDPGSAVRTAIDLSYAAQAPDTRRVFRLLGLIPGPNTTAPAVAALAAVDLAVAERGLRTLAAAHLVEEPAASRYALHELLRLYAADHAAGDGHGPLDRLIAWYVATADQAADALDPARQRLPHPASERDDPEPLSFDDARTALVWLTDEADNLAAVVRLTADRGPRWAAWYIADAMKGFFLRGNTAQWPIVADTALRAAGGDPPATAAIHNSAGALGLTRGDHASAIDHFGKALDAATAAHWPLGQATALSNLGLMHYYTGPLATAIDYLDRANTIATGDAGCLVHRGPIQINLGATALAIGRPTEAAVHLDRALAIQRETGYDRGRGMALLLLAETHLH